MHYDLCLTLNMAARKKSAKINLLPQEEFAASTLGRILTWILTSFRYMVIVTELVVILAFLSRFWLDARTTDLNEQIKQKQAIVAASSSFESQYRLAQKRLEVFSSITEKEAPITSLLNSISSYLPPEAFMISLSKIEKDIQLKGQSFTERAIAQFIANLKSSGLFEQVSLTHVDTSERNASMLVFGLRLSLKENK